jgi:DNA-binding MarR family transcriptional regulator
VRSFTYLGAAHRPYLTARAAVRGSLPRSRSDWRRSASESARAPSQTARARKTIISLTHVPLTEPPNISADDRVGRVAEFRIALQRFERTSDQVVRRSGLTPRQHLLLLALEGRHAGSASIGPLSRELLLAQSTVTELGDRAQAEGLVERVVARDDARVVLVRTTREGARRLERALAALDRERDRLGLAIGDLDAAFPRVSDPASPSRARGRASDR